MRVMVMIKGLGTDEHKIDPNLSSNQEMMAQMSAYNEQLVKAGIMLLGEGLKPSAAGAKVVFEGGTTSVVDGPFTESKEVIAGYWIWQVASLEEAIEWAKRCPNDPNSGLTEALEIRPLFEMDDFGPEVNPELRAQEEKLAAEIKAPHGEG